MANTRPFDDNDTPQQKRFEAKTDKDSDNATGPVNKTGEKTEGNPDKNSSENTRVPAPSGVDKEAWANAEAAALSKYGGFSGVGKDQRQKQVQEMYDQIADQNKQTREWEGKDENN